MGFIKLGVSTIIIFAVLVFIIVSIRCAITYRSHGKNIFNDKEYREMYYQWLKENFLSVLYVSYSFLFYPVIFFTSCLDSFESEYKAYFILSLLCGKAVLSLCFIDEINKKKIKNKKEAQRLKYELEQAEERNSELRMYNSNLVDRNMQLSDRIELLEKINTSKQNKDNNKNASVNEHNNDSSVTKKTSKQHRYLIKNAYKKSKETDILSLEEYFRVPKGIKIENLSLIDTTNDGKYGRYTIYTSRTGDKIHLKKGCCGADIPSLSFKSNGRNWYKRCFKCFQDEDMYLLNIPEWYIDFRNYKRNIMKEQLKQGKEGVDYKHIISNSMYEADFQGTNT